MPLIVVTSFKGGAGKTTLVANLAVGLRSVGWRVMAVDFNPQDALKLHFGLDAYETNGFATRMLSGGSWEDATYGAEPGVDVMPFGRVSAALSGSVSGFIADDSERRRRSILSRAPTGIWSSSTLRRCRLPRPDASPRPPMS